MSGETNVDDRVASWGFAQGTDAEESTDKTTDGAAAGGREAGVGRSGATRRAVLAATSGAVGALGLGSATAAARAGATSGRGSSADDDVGGTATPTEWLMNGFDLRNSRFPRDANAPTGGIEESWSFDVSVDHVDGGTYKNGRVEYAPPTVADGKVLVGDGSLRSNRNFLHAIDKDTGEHVWRKPMPEMNTAPAVGEGRVFAAGNASFVVGIDLETGKEQWKWGTADIVRSSPKYHDGSVYVGCDDDTFYALDPEEGFSQWEHDTSDDANGLRMYGSPAIHDGVVYVSTWGPEGEPSYMYGLEADDGDEVWKQTLGFGTGGAAPPAVGEGYVFVPNGGRGRMEAYDLGSGRELAWQKQDFQFAPWNGPAVADCRVFVGSYGGHVTAMDVETGEWAWRSDTRAPVEMPVVVANGTVYAVDRRGWLYGFAAKGGEKRFEYRIGDLATTTPRAVDGDLFVASSDDVQRLTGDTESFSVGTACEPEPTTTATPTTTETAEPTEPPTTTVETTRTEAMDDAAATTTGGAGESPGFGVGAAASALAAAAGVALRRARRDDDAE
ncbi:PQQ-binding-like beta-propeller repeat protein [Halorubellus sp. PRR65]|uniref:outer membrane protein assembly factor BamB family protein n=1 Tax=Halorubellus sp. PRR65 TaxID=3098148 RepID=UPI002B262E76|nr:PQQ-binding-like beta-propeller repeat protein [Halorubellus sp. PRR65]